MTDVYPGIDDWDRQALDLLPGIARAGAGADWFLANVLPLSSIELEVESLAREVSNIESAGLYVARMTALRYGVTPWGMAVGEVRRLAAGGAAALACDGTDSRTYAMWTALTGATQATVRTFRSVSTPSYDVRLTASIAWEPSRQWLEQAGRIVARCVEAGGETEATVYLGGSLFFDALPGLDGGVMSYALPV